MTPPDRYVLKAMEVCPRHWWHQRLARLEMHTSIPCVECAPIAQALREVAEEQIEKDARLIESDGPSDISTTRDILVVLKIERKNKSFVVRSQKDSPK